jgi:hypothetical protein
MNSIGSCPSLKVREPESPGLLVGKVREIVGQILELSHTQDTQVNGFREDGKEPGRLSVWRWEFSPVFYLTRDNPESDRIRARLAEAKAESHYGAITEKKHGVLSWLKPRW